MGNLKFLGVLFFLSCGPGPWYIMEQGYYHFKYYFYYREPIDKAISSKDFPEKYRRKIRLIKLALKFAREQLGLKVEKNYKYFVRVSSPPLFYMLFASSKYCLKPYTWNFLIVGKMGYLGFFKRDSAYEYAKKLENNGFDVYISPGLAYSTLGWFSDPLFSTFLDLEEHYLIFLLYHELTHSTFYKKGDTAFNERFANFVGLYGMLEFFKNMYGDNSKEYKIGKYLLDDLILLGEFYRFAINAINNFYKNCEKEPYKLKMRERFYIEKIFNNFNEHYVNKFLIIKPKIPEKINNGYFVSKMYYSTNFDDFYLIYEKNRENLKKTIRDIIFKYENI